MVVVAQLVEPRIVIPVVVGSSPIIHPKSSAFWLYKFRIGVYNRPLSGIVGLFLPVIPTRCAKVAKLVDALDLGSSAARRESSSLSFRTMFKVQVYS